MKRLLELFRFLRPHRRAVMVAALVLVAYGLLLLSLPWWLREMIDAIFQSRDGTRLRLCCLVLLAALPVFGLLVYLQNYLVCQLGNRLIADLRMVVFHRLLELPMAFFGRHRPGEVISRVTADITVIQESLMLATLGLLRQGLLLGGGVALMLAIHGRLALLVLLGVPAMVLVFRACSGRLRELATLVQDRSADLSTIIAETLTGIADVKAHAREPFEQERFTVATERRFAALSAQNRARSAVVAVAAMAVLVLLAVILWHGGGEVVAGRMTPGDLVALMLYLGLALGPVAESARRYACLQEAIGASQRVYEMLGTAPEEDTEGAGTMADLRGGIAFASVTFRYPGAAAPALAGIDLTIRPGERVALVGRSGAGKTTLVHLLLRFHEPCAGEILLDGRPLRGLPLAGLRRQVGLVSQETFLFGGSVADNLRYARPDATDAEVVAAATAADAHGFIMALPAGYGTELGERGMRLSAGQRQRLSIARMLLKDPRLVLLDEVTSALDPEAAATVGRGLAELLRGRTVIIITQDLAALPEVDRIVVLDQGRVAEMGTAAELLSREEGLFRRLHALARSRTREG